MVKIDFTKTDGELVFVDCIVLPEDNNLTDAQIEQIKTDRFNQWLEARSLPDTDDSAGQGI